VLFGRVADRLGRTPALVASMLIYCVCTGLCGLAHTGAQLALFRVLLGFGMGGEWAAGAALVAESWPDEHRAKALALVQSSWAVGYALAALLVALIMPHYGWRPVFFAGLLPAALALWIRRTVHEPPRPQTSSHALHIFEGETFRRLSIATLMNAATLFAWWGLFFWIPTYLSLPRAQGGRGLSIVQTSTWTILMQAGTFLGYVSYGVIADRVGRKRTYIAYLLVAACVVQLYARATNPITLLWLGPLVGFWGSGYFSGFAVIASELFPTSIRGSAMGIAYNTGRIVSAAAPYLVGRASGQSSLGPALGITSLAFLTAAGLAFLLPETLRKSARVPVSTST
jgi:MFS family permease